MMPSFHDGDIVLATTLKKPTVGDVVVCRDPRHRDQLMLKRVAALGAGTYTLAGDNESASTDSRLFGPVFAREILGTVIFH